MKKLLMILLILLIIPLGLKFQENIPDKYISSLNYLIEKNIVKGFPDGTFKLDWAISEAEFLTLIVRCNLKFEKEKSDLTILEKIKNFFHNLFRSFQYQNKTKFLDYQEKWFHPYLIEYSNLTKIKEDEIEPYLFLNIYKALYFIILASPFKGEIENISFPLDNKAKSIIIVSAVSHRYFPDKIKFNDKLSRGDAFLLIEKYLRSKEDAINN